jgi:hypothetical protein
MSTRARQSQRSSHCWSTRLLTRSPGIATLCIVRNDVHVGYYLQDNAKSGTSRFEVLGALFLRVGITRPLNPIQFKDLRAVASIGVAVRSAG